MQENIKKQSIAIIGSGITGLSASWLLGKHYDVSLYEKNDYLGGHTHTHDIQEESNTVAVDSGFIVYNEKNYPNLVGLFNHLNVTTQATDMSFAFSLNKGELEYAGTGLSGMFAQRGNLIRIKHWKLLNEIVRFNKTAHAVLGTEKGRENPIVESSLTASSKMTLGQFLKQYQFTTDLQHNYLLPMGAAIWSCPVEIMVDFPAYSFLRFFANHGLINLKDRPQWRTVVGGSREYIRKMMSDLESNIDFKTGAISVVRNSGIVSVESQQGSHEYDHVIFACHADEALALLSDNASSKEKEILGCFGYQENHTYLHTDESLMPQRKKAWCSWNYLATHNEHSKDKVTATYWMNRLQRLNSPINYLVTLNPFEEINPNKIIKKMTYHHPVFDRDALKAQGEIGQIQGKQNSWFCGSYCGYGFHEDALSSSVNVCKKLGVIAPWLQHKERKQEA